MKPGFYWKKKPVGWVFFSKKKRFFFNPACDGAEIFNFVSPVVMRMWYDADAIVVIMCQTVERHVTTTVDALAWTWAPGINLIIFVRTQMLIFSSDEQ